MGQLIPKMTGYQPPKPKPLVDLLNPLPDFHSSVRPARPPVCSYCKQPKPKCGCGAEDYQQSFND